MQIVIDVPNSLYNHITTNIEPNRQADDMLNVLISSIVDGTPLPKSHGRIADMDEAIKCIEDCEGEDAIWAISLIEWACSKRTLIEAKSEE